MKNILKIVIVSFYFFSFDVSAQHEKTNVTDAAGKKQGHWIKLDEDKKKIYEGNFMDNVPVGKFTYFYDTGTPWSVTVFSNGGAVAYTQMYDAGGTMTGEGKYIKEKKDSLWKFYGANKKILSTENYNAGVKHGVFKVYFTNGEMAEEMNWKNGVLEGTCTKYFESGQMKFQRQYVNNKVEGKCTFYYPSGKITAEGTYKNDVKNGPWKFYKEDGTLERTDVFSNGRLIGKKDPNIISKEQEEKEKKQSEQFEIKDQFKDQ